MPATGVDYDGSMTLSTRLAALALACASLHGTALFAQSADPSPPENSALSGELLYQLLLGELNTLNGEPGVGYSLLLDAARKTGDERLFKRATDIALQNRSGESALQAARAWRQALPESRDANRYLLQILIGLNRQAEALEPLRRELSQAKDTERASALLSLPRLFGRSADKKAAAALVEQAVTPYLDSPTAGTAAWAAVGSMRLEAGDLGGTLVAIQRAQALDKQSDAPAILANALLVRKVPQAEEAVRTYLGTPNPRLEVRLDYARALISVQRYEDALTQLTEVTRQAPENAPAWLIKGSMEQQLRQFPAARESLVRYVQLQSSAARTPENRQNLTRAYLQLSEMALQNKDAAAAQQWLDRIEDADDMLLVQSMRAGILAREGKLAEARALIQGVPATNAEEEVRKVNAEYQLLREQQQYQAAYDLLQAATERHPQDLDLLYNQAMMAEKLERLDEMERLLRQAIARKPDYHHAYNALGYSLADRGVRLPEARELVRKALEFAPDDPFITDSLGWVEFRAGNLNEALRILQKAFDARPDAEIAAHLGEVLWVLGNRSQAEAIWKQGQELNADNETLQSTIQRLRGKP